MKMADSIAQTAAPVASKLTAPELMQSTHARVALLLGRVVFYSLITLIAFVALPYGTVEPWWQALFECAVFTLAALWLVEGWLSGSWQLSRCYVLLPLLALAGFGLVQTLSLGGVWLTISADPHGTRLWAARMLALILVGALLLRYTSDGRRLRLLIYLVIGVAVASAAFGLLRQMTQHEVGFGLPYLKPGFGYAQFINKNHFPFLIEMALGLVLGLAVSESERAVRWPFYLGIALLLSGALVSANSRGGVFSLLCQLLCAALFFSAPQRRRDAFASDIGSHAVGRAQRLASSPVMRALLAVCLLLAVVVGVVWVGGDPLASSVESMPIEVGAPAAGVRWAVRRADIWPATWQMFKDHKTAGVGFGGYWMAITAYHNGSGEMTPQEAHNDYLEFLASGRLIGVVLGAWFIYVFSRRVRARLRAPDKFRRAVSVGALTGLAGVAVHSFVDFGLHPP